jgi:hypothetical protein
MSVINYYDIMKEATFLKLVCACYSRGANVVNLQKCPILCEQHFIAQSQYFGDFILSGNN